MQYRLNFCNQCIIINCCGLCTCCKLLDLTNYANNQITYDLFQHGFSPRRSTSQYYSFTVKRVQNWLQHFDDQRVNNEMKVNILFGYPHQLPNTGEPQISEKLRRSVRVINISVKTTQVCWLYTTKTFLLIKIFFLFAKHHYKIYVTIYMLRIYANNVLQCFNLHLSH